VIERLPTSTAALLGEALRGPLEPRLVTSLIEFRRYFGPALSGERYLAEAVEGFFLNGGKRLFVCRIAPPDAATAAHASQPIKANSPGEWGNRVFVQVTPNGANLRFNIRVACFDVVPAELPANPFAEPAVMGTADGIEEFLDLQSSDPSLADHWRKALTQSELIRPGPGEFAAALQQAEVRALAGGSDGRGVSPADYLGMTVGDRQTGLLALAQADYDEASLIAAPGLADTDVIAAICAHCDDYGYRLAVLDGPQQPTGMTDLDPRAQWDTSRAAYYVPWLELPDNRGGSRNVPPSGHVLGVYARVDNESGVWKAPANEVVEGVRDLSIEITESEQDILNLRGVNVIRKFEPGGIRLWGARTLSTAPDYKYIPVRRLLSWTEHSIERSLQWVVFEPNNETLWIRVTAEITDFLTNLWRDGALMGNKQEQAFFVRCDHSTMTMDDILNGRLICEIGVAPLRPAEFVYLRIFQRTAEAIT